MKRKIRFEFLIILVVLLGLFLVSCDSSNIDDECTHLYINGICSKCNHECEHLSFDDDICVECGVKLQDVCNHEYNRGECDKCGYKCPHKDATHGICDECNMNIQNNCKHTFIDGVCSHCELICDHKRLKNGICMVCGIDYRVLCQHNFVSGKCTVCTYECNHEGTQCLEECKVCKMIAGHKYEGGKCSMCGKESKMVIDAIPEEFLKDCPNKGTVEKVVFTSYDYVNNRDFENTFFVYLPYGYDKSSDEEYNVLYLLHGSGENAAYWLAQLSYAGGYTETTKVVLDNLHYYGVCEKTIVVTPTENLNGTQAFYKELVNNIMPQAESRYKTKAHLYGKDVKDIKNEDFIASRDYRAYAGLSLGSMIGWSIMAYDLPYFSYYGYYSGGTWSTYCHQFLVDIEKSFKDPNNKYTIKFAFHSCGDQDSMYNNHLSDYQEVVRESCGKLNDEVNCMFLTKPGFAHRYNAWIIDLYNSLGYAFFKYN